MDFGRSKLNKKKRTNSGGIVAMSYVKQPPDCAATATAAGNSNSADRPTQDQLPVHCSVVSVRKSDVDDGEEAKKRGGSAGGDERNAVVKRRQSDGIVKVSFAKLPPGGDSADRHATHDELPARHPVVRVSKSDGDASRSRDSSASSEDLGGTRLNSSTLKRVSIRVDRAGEIVSLRGVGGNRRNSDVEAAAAAATAVGVNGDRGASFRDVGPRAENNSSDVIVRQDVEAGIGSDNVNSGDDVTLRNVQSRLDTSSSSYYHDNNFQNVEVPVGEATDVITSQGVPIGGNGGSNDVSFHDVEVRVVADDNDSGHIRDAGDAAITEDGVNSGGVGGEFGGGNGDDGTVFRDNQNNASGNPSQQPLDLGGDSGGAHQRKSDFLMEDERSYTWIAKQFQELAGEDGSLNKAAFQKALQVKKSFFADRLFQLFDDNNSGSIDLKKLLQGLQTLTKGTSNEKLRFLFRIYDADNSGTISREELGTVLRSCMEESSLILSEENLECLTDALFDDADVDRSGAITFDKLQAQLDRHPGVMNNLTISAAKWLMPPKKRTLPPPPRHLTLTYFYNNRVKVIFAVCYLLVTAGLFVLNSWLYRNYNWYLIIARGAGMALDFNCAMVVVLMLRKSLTFLRNTPLVRVLPFDQHVMFHKMAGYLIVLFTLVHTIAHIGNAAVYLTKSTRLSLVQIFFTLKADVGWVAGFALLSGVILDVILLIMLVCSLDFVRRSGYFEVFYWTHQLYIPFMVLNILHSPNFWKWLVAPGVVWLVEKALKLPCIRRVQHGAMFIESVDLLPSGVTQLSISRPSSFDFMPGDYVYLNIPALARFEWHPFTISSAPEMEGSFQVHIRSAGHWTRQVYTYFQDIVDSEADPEAAGNVNGGYANGRLPNSSSTATLQVKETLSFRRRNTKARKIQSSRRKRVKSVKVHVAVHVNGPYGTPSRHIFEAEHAVLIGSGIGVTPFASLLQSIMYRFKEAEVICPSCSCRFSGHIPRSVMTLKKVDFVWINRDQRNFEWFLTLLTNLERQQARDGGALGRVLDMHMYMTSALSKQDMKGIGLQMALDLIHEAEQTDLITGLQTRTQPGRPDWDKLFSQIASNAKGKVKVFFCGAPALGRTLKTHCQKYGFSFSQENF